MAKKKIGHDKANIVKEDKEYKSKCIKCNTEYTAKATWYKNGDVVISPPRCEKCQTVHLTNLRVNGTIEKFKHLRFLKSRLTPDQRNAIVAKIHSELEVLMDCYAGSAVSVGSFDISKI